jgi:hypothetical protein
MDSRVHARGHVAEILFTFDSPTDRRLVTMVWGATP